MIELYRSCCSIHNGRTVGYEGDFLVNPTAIARVERQGAITNVIMKDGSEHQVSEGYETVRIKIETALRTMVYANG